MVSFRVADFHAAARYMHKNNAAEKNELTQCTVFCHNEAQERHLHWVLDQEYLDLMRDSSSAIFQGDELKQSIDEAFGPIKVKKEGDELSDEADNCGDSSDSDD